MAVFFELTTNVFKENFAYIGRGTANHRAGASSVRRPMRGLEVKEDTFAVLKVVDMLGREIKLYDSGSYNGKSTTFTNFILQSVQEGRDEKFQVVETFGDPYIFFFGEAPRFLDCTAMLLNSADFNWQAEFWENYDRYLRGSKCAEIGARIYMFYDDIVVEGYMIHAVAVRDAPSPMAIPLQFKMFLTNYRNLSMVGDPRFPIRLGVDVAEVTVNSETGVYKAASEGSYPQRGLIYDNADEWTGTRPFYFGGNSQDDADADLIQAAVEEAAKNAADMSHVDTLADAGITRANRGQGTGGSAPRASNASKDTVGDSSCVSSTYVRDGVNYCMSSSGEVALGPACGTSTTSCANPPPKTPPGSSSGDFYPGSTATQPPVSKQPQSVNTDYSDGSSSGAFTSTAVPNSSQCLDPNCTAQ